MFAEIITIGDEILSGKTLDTNSSFIASKIMRLGIDPRFMTTINDDEKSIIDALDLALNRVDIVFVTGGLGPTHDDITKHTLAKYFGQKLLRDEELLQRLQAYFSARNRVLDELNYTQADFPEKALKLYNDRGTATGMAFQKDKQWVFSMPGVPYEMKQMMNTGVEEVLMQHCKLSPFQIKDIQTIGLSESKMATALSSLHLDQIKGLKFAYLPKLGRVTLRIYYRSDFDTDQLDQIVQRIRKEIQAYIFDENGLDINEKIGAILVDRKETIAVAESCTGGYLGHLITTVSGASRYFKGGVLAYSNEVKIEQLNVDVATLEKHGAVSEETVLAMAKNVREKYKTDYGIAISGIAGPDGGTEEKPVGTVCIGVASKEQTITRTYVFYKIRALNIESSAIQALRIFWKYFLQ